MDNKNPFTHTPGRTGDAGITTHLEEKVYENLSHEMPSESVYKIMGIRGSGKTVVFSNIINHYRSEEMKKEGWLSYELSSARDPLNTLISYLMLDKDVKKALRSESLPSSISISTPFGGFGASTSGKTDIDPEVRLEQLIGILMEKDKKIIIGIDDISRTPEMIRFCSVFAKLLRNVKNDTQQTPWPIYLICSGIYQNFFELSEEKPLTFFKRAAEIKTMPFPQPVISLMYEELLGVDEDKAISYAALTKGFAFAYQAIGSALYEYADKGEEYALKHAKSELFSQCYEKIWDELSDGEKMVLRAVSDGAKKRKEILADGKITEGSYQVNSTALKKTGLLMDSSKAYGKAQLTLPFFGEYVQKFCPAEQ